MTALDHSATLPTDLDRGMARLEALGQLLHCVDPARWASLARPSAQAIGDLLFMIHADLEAALAEAFEPQQS